MAKKRKVPEVDKQDSLAEAFGLDPMAAVDGDDPKGSAYLGDPEVVEAYLRLMIARVMESINEGKSREESLQVLQEVADEAAGVFLGRDPDYVPIGSWNTVGGIDVALAKHYEIEDPSPEGYVGAVVLDVAQQVFEVTQTVEENPELLDEQWQYLIDGAFEKGRNLLLGMPLPDPDQPEDEEPVPRLPLPEGVLPKVAEEELSRIQEAMLRKWSDYP